MALTINGRTLAALGVTARELSGWLDGPDFSRGSVALPNVLGVLPASAATSSARQIRLVLNVPAATLTARATILATLADAFAGLLSLRFDDTPTRIVRAVAGPFTVASIAPAIGMSEAGKNMTVSVPLLAFDGSSYDDEPRSLVLGATSVEIALGTLPAPGIVQWSGAWSAGAARTLTYRGANGIAYGALVLTPPVGASLTSSEFIEIDLGRRYITKVSATGVRTNAYGWLSAGSWFVPESADGNRGALRWPTFEISAGAGVFFYRRTWAL
jgi:hypothetical protein